VATEVLRLATRGSPLARVQTELAAAALRQAAGVRCETVVVQTTGDRLGDTPVEQLSGIGWFTTDAEAALGDGSADAAVHSAKDLPTQLPDGLAIAALLERADPREALISRDGATLSALPAGATVATSSPRRRAMLRATRPDLSCVPVRGNVGTRLRKLGAGDFDALLLACAGLDRLNLGDRISERLDPETFVPAPAQGVIAIEVVVGSEAERIVATAADAGSTACVAAERAVLRHLGGGCLLPLGAYARIDGGVLRLMAAIPDAAGEIRRAEASGEPADAERIGAQVASSLR